ncbi:MAG: DNA polymerase IV [Phycisphaerales bacterium]
MPAPTPKRAAPPPARPTPDEHHAPADTRRPGTPHPSPHAGGDEAPRVSGFDPRTNDQPPSRTVAHVDVDCFFAQAEQLDRPELRGRPVIVGGTVTPDGRTGRGVVCSCTYEARRFGVRNAMPVAKAVRLCPHGVYLRTNFDRYRELSQRLFEVCRDITPVVQVASLDEAYLDFTGLERRFAKAPNGDDHAGRHWTERAGHALKERVFDATGLVVSVGIGPNRLVAKLASKEGKPDGLLSIRPEQLDDFLIDLPVARIPGVGPAMQRRLARLGVTTIRELRRLGLETLVASLDDTGAWLWDRAHGRASAIVSTGHDRRSISRETTFSTDTTDRAFLRSTLRRLTQSAAWRLRRAGLRAGVVSLKLRYDDFRTVHRDRSLGAARGGVGATDHDDDLIETALTLFEDLYGDARPAGAGARRPVRLIGVGLTRLTAGGGRQLRFGEEDEFERRSRLYATADTIRARFGFDAVTLGPSAKKRRDRQPPPPDEPAAPCGSPDDAVGWVEPDADERTGRSLGRTPAASPRAVTTVH